MKYKIMQINNIESCAYAFMGWHFAEKKFNVDDYHVVYEGKYEGNTENDFDDSISCLLEKLFQVFNTCKVDGYAGHSLSVSDIVVIMDADGDHAYYCDSIGWTDITKKFHPKARYDEIVDYLLSELDDERRKLLDGKKNMYSYIFMICNDLGITEGQ